MLHLLRPRRPGPVFVCSLNEAGDFSRELKAGLLVSISDPERRAITEARLGKMRASICPLDFHDIERPAPDMTAPESHHIEAALAALHRAPAHRAVLVHCHAGISRSSATALVLATARQMRTGKAPDKAVCDAFAQVSAATPHARPNMRVIEIGAEALELAGTSFVQSAWDLHRTA
jgi:predicted protein tyrosine phosphatase